MNWLVNTKRKKKLFPPKGRGSCHPPFSVFCELLIFLNRLSDPNLAGVSFFFNQQMKKLLGLLLFCVYLISEVFAKDYQPTEVILLDCGASSDGSDSDGRKWTTDVSSKFVLSSSKSSVAAASSQATDVTQVPYMTARIFQSEFTYSFPVVPGRKFVRLYFYPNLYDQFNTSGSTFAVTAGPYTLLSNFSAYQTSVAINFDYLVKEYSIYVETETLNITFTPSANYSGTFAFINGIELMSMPSVYDDLSVSIVGQSSTFTIENSTALENVYRLNVGGNVISPTDDTGLFRTWYIDTPYIFGAASGVSILLDQNLTIQYPPSIPSYTAPVDVYSTARSMGPDKNVNMNYNLTWLFSVDAEFGYLVRLHFCEEFEAFSKINQRVFNIYLNNQTAESAADVAGWAGGSGIPVYKDYLVFVTGEQQQDLWLSLHPNMSGNPEYTDAILNGVEIFKVNDSTGNLAGPNPIPSPMPTTIDIWTGERTGSGSKSKKAIIGGAIGGVLALLAIAGLLACVVMRRRKLGTVSSPSSKPSGWIPVSLYGNSHSTASAKTNATSSHASSMPSNLSRHFSFSDIKAATNNFDEALLLGVGGFGKVYKGEIDGGTTKVAIKRGNPLSEQGVHEFQTEIEMLSKLRHRHLVSLLGYCEENDEMILVYDYMAYGTLREHLYKTQKPPLPWKVRLEICVGAARGLHYLHTGAKHTIIHRDVKTTNILLDEKWVAKVSDFGLSKTGPSLDHTHVSTVVKGSFGYLDPEYFRRQQLTDKSDVYSFGVVLFEVLCARPPLNPTLPKEQVSLAEWAPHCQKKGILDQITDPYLKGKIAPECFKKFAETAMKCVADQSINRPSMGDVLWNLEFALQLQETAEESGNGLGEIQYEEEVSSDIECIGKKDHNSSSPGLDSSNVTDSRSTVSIGGRSIASVESEGLSASGVFSQIMNPEGR
ncbi:hypothetical protein V2J09_012153 [Rumex salicifolius]